MPNLSVGRSSSYARLHITPVRNEGIYGLRLVASEATGRDLPSVLDLSLDEQNLEHGRFFPPDYATMLSRVLALIPLDSLHWLHIAHPCAHNSLFTDDVLKHLQSAHILDIDYYPVNGSLLTLSNLERITIKSLKAKMELPSTSPAGELKVNVLDCKMNEASNIAALRRWVGEENVSWDGAADRKCTPSWAMGECPWMAPYAREIQFWKPDAWKMFAQDTTEGFCF